MLIGAVAILMLVTALFLLAFRRRGEASGDGGRDSSIRLWLVGGGLVFPGVVLAALLAAGLVAGEALLPRDRPDLVRVEAVSRQWYWTFARPGAAGPVTRIGVLDIPAGRPVDVAITTRDVIHSFWVPRLGGKMDAIPGRTNILRIEASEPGRYAGVCAEYCGIGHSRDRFEVVAHAPADWARLTGDTR